MRIVSRLENDASSDSRRIAPAQLREYMYAVVPSPFSGFGGRLVRAFSVDFSNYPDRGEGGRPGQWIARRDNVGFVVDKVLSDDVTRIVFDTYRTDPRSDKQGRVGLNEVRVRLYMASRFWSESVWIGLSHV